MIEEERIEYPSAEEEAQLQEVEALRVKAEDLQDQVLRARAELENQRKRSTREIGDAHKFALQSFVRELLPVKDSLESGLEAASTEGGGGPENLQEGIRLTLKLWREVLANAGVEEFDPMGEAFDPELHEALSLRPASGVPANTILQVVQKGYLLNGRLIRPARVVVADGGEQ